MGGALCRPKNGFRKTAKYGFGVVIQLYSYLLYQKFWRLNSVARSAVPHPAAPPRRSRAATQARKIFLFCISGRAQKFFQLRNEIFAGFVLR
jgi:hypothetical protein